MASGDYNFCITQGKPFSLSITARGSDGLPLDLTDYNFSGYFRGRFGDSSPILTCQTTGAAQIYATNPTGGVVLISITAAATALLPPTKLVYDLEAYNTGSGPGEEVIELLRGRVNVWPESTY